MNEQHSDAFEARTRALFQDSVDKLDFAMRSRLTQARHAAIEAAGRRAWYLRWTIWTPAVGVTAAAVLGCCALGGFAAGAACNHCRRAVEFRGS